jgi:hypothetical protein
MLLSGRKVTVKDAAVLLALTLSHLFLELPSHRPGKYLVIYIPLAGEVPLIHTDYKPTAGEPIVFRWALDLHDVFPFRHACTRGRAALRRQEPCLQCV